MSLILPKPFNRSAAIARSFGAHAHAYEQHAGVQRAIADRLAELLPLLDSPRVLELGCGTGLFSRHLLNRYPNGTFVLSDLAQAMVEQCRRNVGGASRQRVSFEVMDADRPTEQAPFDLIAMSMTLHWLTDPAASLERLCALLAPGGVLLYATLGNESFAEWRNVLEAQSLPSGLVDVPELPGIVDAERLVLGTDALSFLRCMRDVGGLTPREGYTPLSAGALRRAIRAADARHGGRVTWHIVYGRLGPQSFIRSRPSIRPA